MTGEIGLATLSLMLLLGAYHGVNPGMGWLFAVALGMQQRNGGAVARSLVPLATGHTLAIGSVVLAAALFGLAVPPGALRYPIGAILIALGLYRLKRHRHPRWVRMQVDFRDLTIWSFLMASAHGAGLMVLPVLLGTHAVEAVEHAAGHHALVDTASPLAMLVATLVHTVGYLAVTGLVAWMVYWKLGLALLRKAWFNLDLIWAGALVGTGIATVLM
jgi:hypothetical protein